MSSNDVSSFPVRLRKCMCVLSNEVIVEIMVLITSTLFLEILQFLSNRLNLQAQNGLYSKVKAVVHQIPKYSCLHINGYL